MLGGGNPVGGANPSGTSRGLNHIGKHAFANSGEVIVSNGTETLFEFNSGSGYLVGSFTYGVDQNGQLGGGSLIGFTISFDGEKIMQMVAETGQNFPIMDFDNNYVILIPPNTNVLIESETSSSGNVPTFGMISGEMFY